MAPEKYRFTFDEQVALEDVAASLILARWATEALHGEPVVALEAKHHIDAPNRQCVVEAVSPAGRDLARLFLGFLRRELAPAQFRVECLPVTQSVPDSLP
jgi:hypothetical protein